jgi:hypothetical protein
MSTSSERLATFKNHLGSYNMAAASNFFSIVAGVGAGTGTYSPAPHVILASAHAVQVAQYVFFLTMSHLWFF